MLTGVRLAFACPAKGEIHKIHLKSRCHGLAEQVKDTCRCTQALPGLRGALVAYLPLIESHPVRMPLMPRRRHCHPTRGRQHCLLPVPSNSYLAAQVDYHCELLQSEAKRTEQDVNQSSFLALRPETVQSEKLGCAARL